MLKIQNLFILYLLQSSGGTSHHVRNHLHWQKQLAFLHDHGIRTTYFVANNEATMAEIVREGHDFIFTDFYSRMRGAYDKTFKELNI